MDIVGSRTPKKRPSWCEKASKGTSADLLESFFPRELKAIGVYAGVCFSWGGILGALRPEGSGLAHFVRVNRNRRLLKPGLPDWKAGGGGAVGGWGG